MWRAETFPHTAPYEKRVDEFVTATTIRMLGFIIYVFSYAFIYLLIFLRVDLFFIVVYLYPDRCLLSMCLYWDVLVNVAEVLFR